MRVPKSLYFGELTTSALVRYTSPANTQTTVSQCSATNISAGAAKVTITVSDDGVNYRFVVKERTLAAGESIVVSTIIGVTLPSGGQVSMWSDTASAIDVAMSGYLTT